MGGQDPATTVCAALVDRRGASYKKKNPCIFGLLPCLVLEHLSNRHLRTMSPFAPCPPSSASPPLSSSSSSPSCCPCCCPPSAAIPRPHAPWRLICSPNTTERPGGSFALPARPSCSASKACRCWASQPHRA